MPSPSTFRLANRAVTSQGFSLIEILVVVSLMSVLFGLGLLMSMDVFRGTTFRSTRQVLISALTLARSRALVNSYQSPHGVCYKAPDFILFRGLTYTSNAATNEVIPGNPSVTLSSVSDFFTCGTGSGIVFRQVAATTTGGAITVHEPGHSDTTVSVTSEGTILW